jgi:hypothetical protein
MEKYALESFGVVLRSLLKVFAFTFQLSLPPFFSSMPSIEYSSFFLINKLGIPLRLLFHFLNHQLGILAATQRTSSSKYKKIILAFSEIITYLIGWV